MWHEKLVLVHGLDKKLVWNRGGGIEKHHGGGLVLSLNVLNSHYKHPSPISESEFFFFFGIHVIFYDSKSCFLEGKTTYQIHQDYDLTISEHRFKESYFELKIREFIHQSPQLVHTLDFLLIHSPERKADRRRNKLCQGAAPCATIGVLGKG